MTSLVRFAEALSLSHCFLPDPVFPTEPGVVPRSFWAWPWPTHLSLLKTTAPACPHQLLLCLGEPWFRRDSSQVPCADTLQSNIQGTAGLVIPKHTPKDSYRDVHGYLSTYLVIFLSTHFSYNHKLYLPLPPTSTDNIIWKLNLDISSSTCHLCRGISGRSWPDIWLVSLILTPVYS